MRTRGVCVALAALLLCAVLLPSSVQAKEPALEWTSIKTPGENDCTVVSPSEVSDIAVGGGGTFYAIDSTFSEVYRSSDAGISWEEIGNTLADAGAGLPASRIVVAPGETDTIAVVTDDGTGVYLSTDGGEEWDDTSVPVLDGAIQAIAISPRYTLDGKAFREIAIGTATWDNNTTTGQVWVLQLGSIWSSWQNQDLAVDPSHVGGEVSALAYSPGYSVDSTLLVVASTSNDVTLTLSYREKTWLCLGERNASAGVTYWDGFAGYGYPAEIATGGDAPGVAYIHSSLALPSDYSSEEESSRQALVSYDRQPNADDDVYWLDDITSRRLNADGGVAIDISSIAYYGTRKSGVLLAGNANPMGGSMTVPVRRTEAPFQLSPSWDLSTVPPTGPGNARLGWTEDGKIAYCGTGQSPDVAGVAHDESGLSASLDGDKWRQMGLLDTVIKIADIAAIPDGDCLFATTSSTYGPEGVWCSAGDPLNGHWYRLLTMDTSTNTVILRLSPDYDEDHTLYAAEAGGTLMALSRTSGNAWEWHYASGPIVDLAVEDEDTIYVALPGGEVDKSATRGRTWKEEPVDTGLSEVNMLTLVDDGILFAGGTNGEVAYSTDGGDSFTRIDEAVGGDSGAVQVLADVGYAENHLIYAATDTPDAGIWRWIIRASSDWKQIDRSITELGAGQIIGALMMGTEGTLYALRLEPASETSGGVTRSFNPTAEDRKDIEFDLVNEALPSGASFDTAVGIASSTHYPKLSGDDEHNGLWELDSSNQAIYMFQDILCKFGPELENPANDTMLPIGVCSCDQVSRLFLGWADLSETTVYEATIYRDPDCIEDMWTGSGTYACDDIQAVGGSSSADLISDNTYYWRVRSIEPMRSPWSDAWSFATALGAAPAAVYPAPGATGLPIRPAFTWDSVAKASSYEFILAADHKFTDLLVALTGDDALTTTAWKCDVGLDYSTTYFWKVRGITDISQGDWITSTFSTGAAPSPPQSQPATLSPSFPETTASVPLYVFVIIGLGIAMVVVLLIYVARTRR